MEPSTTRPSLESPSNNVVANTASPPSGPPSRPSLMTQTNHSVSAPPHPPTLSHASLFSNATPSSAAGAGPFRRPTLLEDLASNYPTEISIVTLENGMKSVWCHICEESLVARPYNVRNHLNTAKHANKKVMKFNYLEETSTVAPCSSTLPPHAQGINANTNRHFARVAPQSAGHQATAFTSTTSTWTYCLPSTTGEPDTVQVTTEQSPLLRAALTTGATPPARTAVPLTGAAPFQFGVPEVPINEQNQSNDVQDGGSFPSAPLPSSSRQESESPLMRIKWKWDLFTDTMANMFSGFRGVGLFIDCEIFCEGQSILCHKIILSGCSLYFERLLTSPLFVNHSRPILFLNGMRFEEVSLLVEFMYRGEITVCENAIQGILEAAKELEVKGLWVRTVSSQQ